MSESSGESTPAFFCYMVQCADGSYYTGWTTDPVRRARQHNHGTGARYTRMHAPVVLVYVEQVADRSAAMKREQAIKNLPRQKKIALVEQYQGTHHADR